MSRRISTYLWFDNNAEQAVEYYLSLFPGSRVTNVMRWGQDAGGPAGSVLAITFELAGQEYIALNGGPHHKFTPAISLFVTCETQADVDALWSRFLATGGKEVACGWLEDRFGLSWQIVPDGVMKLMSDPDPVKSGRVAQVMMGMKKLDLPALERAHAGAN